jgi:DNA-binding MarR family transcriptional regulator
MKRSCGKGRDDDISSEKRIATAVLLGVFLSLVSAVSLGPLGIGGDTPPESTNDIYWNKSLTLEKDFLVESDQTLYIEAGVIVYLGENIGIDVEGRIIANGTAAEPIQFTIKPGSSYDALWRSLDFNADQGSVLEHVVMNMARTGIRISSSSPRFVDSDIVSARSAVAVNSRGGLDSNPIFENCIVSSGLSHFDFDVSGASWVTALNTSFNETKTKMGDPTTHLERQWFLDVHVDNSIPEMVRDAEVTVDDNANGTSSVSSTTDGMGLSSFTATEYVMHYGLFGDNRTYYTPHVVSASKSGYSGDSVGQLWIETNRIVHLTLIDVEKPTTTLIVSGPTHGTAPMFIGATTDLSFDVTPGGTEPVQTKYSINNGSMVLYNLAPFNLVDEGLNNISFYSFDPAGNDELMRSEDLHLDTAAPEVDMTLDSDGVGTDPIKLDSETWLELVATDKGCGVKSLMYSVDGGIYRDYTGKITFSVEKHYNVSYVIQDFLGNSASGNLWFNIAFPVPPIVNNPPYFIWSPAEDGKVGEMYVYHAEAYDPDGDGLTYSLMNSPVGMTIYPNTGLVTWTPETGQEGQNLIFIYVTDGTDGDVQIFYIRVHEKDPEPESNSLLILAGLGAVLTIIGAFTSVTEYGRFRFFLYFLVPLYSKLNRDKVLNQFLRGQIYGYIMAYPGENYSSIKKALGVENGTLTHHLYILEREGFVTSLVDGRYKRFYPTGAPQEAKSKATMIQKAILKMIRQSPNLTQTEIAEALGTSKQVVNYHIKSLQKVGLLSVAKNGSSLEYQDLSKKL